jgi:hypothetical protein
MPWTVALLGAALSIAAPGSAAAAAPPADTTVTAPSPPADTADPATAPLADTAGSPADTSAAPETRLEIGGALRFNIRRESWTRDQGFDFDTFRLNADGSHGPIRFSAEYRFYAGYHMLHHGWVGYGVSDALQLQAGVHKVPFGALPYASHNWFFQLPYYVGLEDDYDAGLKAVYASGPWGLQAAYYMNDEGAFTGSSVASARYSYDVVPTTPEELGYAGLAGTRSNTEVNQLNGRVTYRLSFGATGGAELGLSGQGGQLHNGATDGFGSHWAAGVHIDADYGRWNVIAEALRYGLSPDAAGALSPFVVMGAYDAPYKVARDASLYLLGVAYEVPVGPGPVTSVLLYDDFTYMTKRAPGYADTRQNVLGAAVSAGPLYIYADIASGWNHPWLGPDYGSALAEGTPSAGWDTRFNLNLGYYF